MELWLCLGTESWTWLLFGRAKGKRGDLKTGDMNFTKKTYMSIHSQRRVKTFLLGEDFDHVWWTWHLGEEFTLIKSLWIRLVMVKNSLDNIRNSPSHMPIMDHHKWLDLKLLTEMARIRMMMMGCRWWPDWPPWVRPLHSRGLPAPQAALLTCCTPATLHPTQKISTACQIFPWSTKHPGSNAALLPWFSGPLPSCHHFHYHRCYHHGNYFLWTQYSKYPKLRNVIYFTQNKSFKPNFTPWKLRKSRQI